MTGGMFFDVAYVMRRAMSILGLSGNMIGLLLVAPRLHGESGTNAYGALREPNHYSYPDTGF